MAEYTATPSELLVISDSGLIETVTPSSSCSISDSVTGQSSGVRTVTIEDEIFAYDSGIAHATIDAMGVTDGTRLYLHTPALNTEHLFIAELVEAEVIEESLATTDSASGTTGPLYTRGQVELLLATETGESELSVEAMEVTDGVTRGFVLAATLTDTVEVTDVVARVADYVRSQSDDYYASSQYDGKVGAGTGWYGRAVAVDGNWMAVTDPYNAYPGYVHMFYWNGAWTYRQTLTGSDCVNNDRFGNSVDIHGDTMVVGDYYKSAGGYGGAGVAYVFTCTNYVWSQQQKLEATDPATNVYFGVSVGVSGDWIIVGAGGETTGSGWVYTFKRTTGVWTQIDKLGPGDGGVSDGFGGMRDRGSRCVSICKKTGTTFITGSIRHTHAGYQSDSGAAYVYYHNGSAWGLQQEILPDVDLQQNYFGENCHVDGDTLVITCAGTANGTGSYPAASVYTRSGSTWTWLQRLEYQSVNARGAGNCAAIHETNGYVAFVLPYADTGGTDYGSIVFYKKIGSTYQQYAEIPRTTNTKIFGYGALGMDSQGTRVGVGHYTVGTVNANTQLYSFGSGCFEITEQLYRDDSKTIFAIADTPIAVSDSMVREPMVLNRFAASPYYEYTKGTYQGFNITSGSAHFPMAFDGDSICYIGDKYYNSNVGRVLVYQRSGSTWNLLRTIDNPDASATYFGTAVSAHNGTVAIGAPYKTVGGYTNAGVVWIFIEYGATQQQELQMAHYGENNLYIGTSGRVALYGDGLVIGDPSHDTYGCFHYWTRTGSVWTEQAETPSPVSYSEFAFYVAFDGTRVIANSGFNHGTCSVYTWGGSSWGVEQTLTANSWVNGVDIVGDKLALYGIHSTPNYDLVDIYELVEGTWELRFRDTSLPYRAGTSTVKTRWCADGHGGHVLAQVVASSPNYVYLYAKRDNNWTRVLAAVNDCSYAIEELASAGTYPTMYIGASCAASGLGAVDAEIFPVTVTWDTAVTDSLTRDPATWNRFAIDAVEVPDTALRESEEVKFTTDTVEVSDTVVCTLTQEKSLEDTMAASDSVSVQLFMPVIDRTAEDASEVADEGKRSATFDRKPIYPQVVIYVDFDE